MYGQLPLSPVLGGFLLLLFVIAAILLLPFVVISVSAMFGLSLLKPTPQTILLALLLLAYLLPHVFILAEDRFHLALVPYFIILAVHCWKGGFAGLSARWNGSLTGKVLVSLAFAAALLLFLNWGFELTRDADKIAQLLGPNGNKSYFSY